MITEKPKEFGGAENGIGIITQGSSNFPQVGSGHLRDKTGKEIPGKNYSIQLLQHLPFRTVPTFPSKMASLASPCDKVMIEH